MILNSILGLITMFKLTFVILWNFVKRFTRIIYRLLIWNFLVWYILENHLNFIVPFAKEIEIYEGAPNQFGLLLSSGIVELLFFLFWTILMSYIFIKFHQVDDSSKISKELILHGLLFRFLYFKINPCNPRHCEET